MTSIAKKNLYGYSKGEEIFNWVSHTVGAALGVAALVLMIVFAAIGKGTALDIVGVSIFGATLIILYTISTLYHALTNEKAKKVFKVLDHCSIYVLIPMIARIDITIARIPNRLRFFFLIVNVAIIFYLRF